MTRLLLGAALLAALPALAAAQAPPAPAADAATTAVRSVALPYESVKRYVLKAAEDMPMEKYGYRPVDGVRTFGQLVGHIADAQQMFCSGALGEAAPTTSIERTATTKEALVAGLRASITTCDRAYAQPDSAALQPMTLFGQATTRLGTLAMNAAHSYEHYGNLVTYLRMNGMVPPSSQGGAQ